MWGKQGHMLRERRMKMAIKRLIKNMRMDMLEVEVRRRRRRRNNCDVTLECTVVNDKEGRDEGCWGMERIVFLGNWSLWRKRVKKMNTVCISSALNII